MYFKFKLLIVSILIIFILNNSISPKKIPIIKSKIIKDICLNCDLPWYDNMKCLGIPNGSSKLIKTKKINYNYSNICDFDLNTAWIEGKNDYGIGEYFTFKIKLIKEPGYKWGMAEEFSGTIVIFNGYYKSKKTWQENSRVKTLKMYFKNKPICFITLLDTRQPQYFNIIKFFKFERYVIPTGKIEVKEGDILKFKIVDIYKGTKYKDTAITEFIGERVSP